MYEIRRVLGNGNGEKGKEKKHGGQQALRTLEERVPLTWRTMC